MSNIEYCQTHFEYFKSQMGGNLTLEIPQNGFQYPSRPRIWIRDGVLTIPPYPIGVVGVENYFENVKDLPEAKFSVYCEGQLIVQGYPSPTYYSDFPEWKGMICLKYKEGKKTYVLYPYIY